MTVLQIKVSDGPGSTLTPQPIFLCDDKIMQENFTSRDLLMLEGPGLSYPNPFTFWMKERTSRGSMACLRSPRHRVAIWFIVRSGSKGGAITKTPGPTSLNPDYPANQGMWSSCLDCLRLCLKLTGNEKMLYLLVPFARTCGHPQEAGMRSALPWSCSSWWAFPSSKLVVVGLDWRIECLREC